jgi:hypothetical protein
MQGISHFLRFIGVPLLPLSLTLPGLVLQVLRVLHSKGTEDCSFSITIITAFLDYESPRKPRMPKIPNALDCINFMLLPRPPDWMRSILKR